METPGHRARIGLGRATSRHLGWAPNADVDGQAGVHRSVARSGVQDHRVRGGDVCVRAGCVQVCGD
eukprot:1900361-Heterocapsa_arctica.AAC.1